jgi:integrase
LRDAVGEIAKFVARQVHQFGKPHAHVHMMLNAVHPETGLHLDDGFERRRAQEWALAYEREHERIYCEQRLKNPEDREKNADKDFRVKLAFASATGVRAGELHALRWRHLDLANGEVKIETRVDAYGDEDVTKTAAGMRTIPLSQPLILMLKEWKVRTKRKKPDELVFPNKRGWYTGHDNMVKRKFFSLFDMLAEKHREDPRQHPEVPDRFNWHALRHFAISTWIEAGLSPKTVQTFAGHSSLQVTMDRYGHMFKSDDHKVAMNTIAESLFE